MAKITGWPRDSYAFHADELSDTFAGLVRRDGAGLPVDGVLGDVQIEAVDSSWQVAVSPFLYVERVGTGVRWSGESAVEHVDITPAAGNIPAGEARIDLVCWDTTEPELVVVDGTPAVSPVPPSDGGLVPFAQVRVNAGDGQTIQGQVSKVAGLTGLVTQARVAQGVVAKRNVGRGNVAVVAVSFPPGLFTSVPNVQVTTLSSTRIANAIVDDVSVSGCTIRLVNSGSVAGSMGALWRAEQL